MLSNHHIFDYLFEVTTVPVSGTRGRLREAIRPGPYSKRLVGYAPVFDAVEYSPHPEELICAHHTDCIGQAQRDGRRPPHKDT